jgi:hypothetical protein
LPPHMIMMLLVSHRGSRPRLGSVYFSVEYTQLHGCFIVFIRQVTTSDDSREKQMVCIMNLLVRIILLFDVSI